MKNRGFAGVEGRRLGLKNGGGGFGDSKVWMEADAAVKLTGGCLQVVWGFTGPNSSGHMKWRTWATRAAQAHACNAQPTLLSIL